MPTQPGAGASAEDAERKRKWRPLQVDETCKHGFADMCKSKPAYEA